MVALHRMYMNSVKKKYKKTILLALQTKDVNENMKNKHYSRKII